MNKLTTYILAAAIFFMAGSLSAQTNAENQYCGGSKGSVTSPAGALENDFVKHSTLKLRNTASSSAREYVYQNFIFPGECKKGGRIAFVLQGDQNFAFEKDLNIKFYTLSEGKTNADTLFAKEVEIKKVRGTEDLYEFSFYTTKSFNEAGIMIYGGGIVNNIKIYGVYQVEMSAPSKLISLQNN